MTSIKRKISNIYSRRKKRIARSNCIKKATELFNKAGLLTDELTKREKKELQECWSSVTNSRPTEIWHKCFKQMIGYWDVRFVPHDVWIYDILPACNDEKYWSSYMDKNLSDIFLKTTGIVRTPLTVVRRIHGSYYSHEYQPVSRDRVESIIMKEENPLIIKSSDDDDGRSVERITPNKHGMMLNGQRANLDELEAMFGTEYIVQQSIIQCKEMASVHPESVNTLRVVTFRWNRQIHHLLSFARFGTHGRVTDNAGTGGLCCGIDDYGKLFSKAIDENLTFYSEHPTTGYSFSKRAEVPSFSRVIEAAKKLHEQIMHFNIISWDFAIDENYEPVLIEINYRGVSWIYQIACQKPIFGDFTDRLIHQISKDRGNRRKLTINNRASEQ